MSFRDKVSFAELVGKTLVEVKGAEVGSDSVTFKCDDGQEFRMHHSQDCCENVALEEVHGEASDLIGSPILLAEESTSESDPEGYKPESDYRESFTWTFYRLVTIKGAVQLRWLGESNGYYSEGVDFEKVAAA